MERLQETQSKNPACIAYLINLTCSSLTVPADNAKAASASILKGKQAATTSTVLGTLCKFKAMPRTKTKLPRGDTPAQLPVGVGSHHQ